MHRAGHMRRTNMFPDTPLSAPEIITLLTAFVNYVLHSAGQQSYLRVRIGHNIEWLTSHGVGHGAIRHCTTIVTRYAAWVAEASGVCW
jgi:hypothetical protein